MMSDEKLRETAKAVVDWYYIFGEDNQRARELLADLGNALLKIQPTTPE